MWTANQVHRAACRKMRTMIQKSTIRIGTLRFYVMHTERKEREPLKTLAKTIQGINGELLAIINAQRHLIARCRPSIEIYEDMQNVTVLGSVNCHTKTIHAAIVLCVDREVVKNLDASQWRNAEKFELVGDFERGDGVFERVTLDSIVPVPQNLSDEVWVFEIPQRDDIIRKLVVF